MKEIWIDRDRCIGCLSCTMACTLEHSQSKNVHAAVFEKPLPESRMRVEHYGRDQFPVQCRHCEDSPCVYACMAGALTKDEDTGLVVHNNEQCVGCWMCVMVCPFGAILPAYKQKLALKCDLCPEKNIPACVEACPTKALSYIDFKDASVKIRKDTTAKIESFMAFSARGRE